MAQYDVYEHPGERLRAEYPFVIDLQADLLSSFDTRVIVPLRRAELLPAIKRLNPSFTVDGIKVVLVPTEIVAIRRNLLGPPVTSLAKEHFAITAALDLMLTGI
ncbi:Toxin CcdB [Bosea sp. 62]|uniref:CcdB family protein n=1 Tax=unclassified Bosea (in: a-proteobacteria) TaxID=2653178 RepID=UPI00125447F2|nr:MULTISPECIES: CcdB family protein [unclassified Bosea (in: a-proteobacteria)]CAD5260466.1 Toxin CcdB [Bosea sp. 46]CAD5264983.1 Toxin CcdB [Bosea sp. 21B]CAD5275343.1 Toxin CcdB [Bosea sp. 7B]VVT59162.1 Toxin CcdB [Bosea sp. EC-HK365B]VXB71874.1 Toxin CcdB [Bosea sp. 29B]